MADGPEKEAESVEDSILKALEEYENATEDDDETAEPEAAETEAEEQDEPEEPAEDETEAEDEDDEQEGEALAAPKHWSAEDKAAFDALPDELKPMWLEKSKSLEGGYQEKFQALARDRETLERLKPIDAAFEPYRERLALEGVSEAQVVQRLLAAQSYLERAPVEAIGWLAKSYGVDLGQFAPKADQDDFIDPTIAPLKQELDSLKAHLSQRDQQEQAQSQQQLLGQIAAFKSATDEAGQPKHPHFDRVRAHMGAFMQVDPSMTMEDAYERAIWAASDLREGILKQRETEAAKARDQERRQEVEKAKKAGKSKTKSRSTPSQPAPAKSHAEELERQLEAAGFK